MSPNKYFSSHLAWDKIKEEAKSHTIFIYFHHVRASKLRAAVKNCMHFRNKLFTVLSNRFFFTFLIIQSHLQSNIFFTRRYIDNL